MVAYIDGDEVVVDLADYFARPVRLTAAEGLALLAAGMALASSGAAPEALHTAVAKLAGVLVPDDGTLDGGPAAAARAGGHPRRGREPRRGRAPDLHLAGAGRDHGAGGRAVEGLRHAGQLVPERALPAGRGGAGLPRSIGSGRRFPPGSASPRRPSRRPAEVRYAPGADDVSAVIALAPGRSVGRGVLPGRGAAARWRAAGGALQRSGCGASTLVCWCAWGRPGCSLEGTEVAAAAADLQAPDQRAATPPA